MMTGTVQNRDAFLGKIASSLGRGRRSSGVTLPMWKHRPQDEVLQDASTDDLVEVLKTQCLKIHTTLIETTLTELPVALKEAVSQMGGGSIVVSKDERYNDWGLGSLLSSEWPQDGVDVHEWDAELGEGNIVFAEKANVGIVVSEMTLAESGTVVLLSDRDHGRTVSFLPSTLIALVPKSSLVPRITQAAKMLREQHLAGKTVASCINFITGPSNSADIELNLVVGVHGPVKASYILINDL